ncbi:MAG TPA: tetratricopeptide repeat protein [Terriglobales bacterium]|jgi:tetratricopeptide (TPR) repeat protein|nr:tetratricopeptide repeat protein [Terriglobales bacterium]
MNKKLIAIFATTTVLLLAAAAGWSQTLARVHGKCTDTDGKPMVGLTIEFLSQETGKKSSLQTDNKGEFTSIAIPQGKYTISMVEDGKVIHIYKDVPVTSSEQGTNLEFDLQKEMREAQKNPEFQKKAAEQVKENAKINTLNKMLTDAHTAEQAGNWQQAVQIMNDAIAIDTTHDVIWAHLGDAELGAGSTATSKDDATPHFQKAIESYKKAIDLAEKAPAPTDNKKGAAVADSKATLGKYHNNLGQAYAKTGQPKEALDEYTTAAQDDPPNASMYYFNAGATLTNQATKETDSNTKQKDIDDANAAFDKAIEAKPDYAEAYYQKGINLTSQATIDKSGKIMPAPGTVEAFNKYLELDPEGKHVEEAKGLIEGFGATVSTTYKKAKATPPAKK